MPPNHSIWNGNVFQDSYYAATNTENVLYGIELLLYFKTMRILLSSRRVRKISDVYYVLFSTTIVFSATVWVIALAVMGREMWLINFDIPGGANAYWQKHSSIWYMDWARASMVVLQLMTDGLMMYRCRIVWVSYRIVVIPIILWLGTLALGILVIWTSSVPAGDIFTGLSSHLGLAYWTTSVALNSMLTGLICYRLVQHAKMVQEHVGSEHASLYFTITAIVVESVLPSTLSGIAFLVTSGIGSPTAVAFGSVYAMMMCISPQMLILRVIVGRAWSNDIRAVSTTTRIQFRLGAMSSSQEGSHSTGTAKERVHELSHLEDGHDKP